VHPGKTMPGRMGGQYHTIEHLKVIRVDDENGLLVVHGHVSGPRNTIVAIQDSKRRPEQLQKLGLPMVPGPMQTGSEAMSETTVG
jgi:ribosomal protein L3